MIDKYDIKYPVSELIMAAGFFLVLTIEILAMDHQKRLAKRENSHNSLNMSSNGDSKHGSPVRSQKNYGKYI